MDLNLIQQVLIAVLIPVVTQGVKKIQGIPINSGQKGRILTFVAVLSFLASAGTAWLNGELESFLSPEMIEVGINTLFSFTLSILGYEG